MGELKEESGKPGSLVVSPGIQAWCLECGSGSGTLRPAKFGGYGGLQLLRGSLQLRDREDGVAYVPFCLREIDEAGGGGVCT